MDSAEVPCRSYDPDLWFSSVRNELSTAISLCRNKCPHLHECLSGALERQEAAGVWGGRHIVEGKISTLPGTTRRYSVGRRFHALSKAPEGSPRPRATSLGNTTSG